MIITRRLGPGLVIFGYVGGLVKAGWNRVLRATSALTQRLNGDSPWKKS